jgi:hypothetical protein
VALGHAREARAGGSLADVDAAARAAGNRRPVALAIGRTLFARTWPVQILKVRVDGTPGHDVAGLILSGVTFHERLSVDAFVAEVAELVRETFAASDVEEVDLWVTVPLRVGQHAVVAGDKAQPTTRIVYGATVRRDAGPALVQRLSAGDAVYWDAEWRAGLQAPSHRAPHDSAPPNHE